MRFDVRLSPNALRDRDRILAYYDEPERSQGDRFLDDFFSAARLIADLPEIGRVINGDVRRWHLRTFPYQLWYRVSPGSRVLRVIAVVGDSQDEGRFADRLGPL